VFGEPGDVSTHTGSESTCSHHWTMTDVRSGFLVVEGCYHCGARSSFFSDEPAAPMDEYREGEHIWEYLSDDQAVSFGLCCEKCGASADLSAMTGLMMSLCEDPDCAIGRLQLELGATASIYVALCGDSTHESSRCVSEEGVAALEAYFNQGRRPGRRRIVVVPCSMRSDSDCCRGVVISDAGLTDL
jgi:hypothetical protein